MSWPIFAVIQLGIVTVGVTVAFWPRNRQLNKRWSELETAGAKVSVSEQLISGTSAQATLRDQWEEIRTTTTPDH